MSWNGGLFLPQRALHFLYLLSLLHPSPPSFSLMWTLNVHWTNCWKWVSGRDMPSSWGQALSLPCGPSENHPGKLGLGEEAPHRGCWVCELRQGWPQHSAGSWVCQVPEPRRGSFSWAPHHWPWWIDLLPSSLPSFLFLHIFKKKEDDLCRLESVSLSGEGERTDDLPGSVSARPLGESSHS